MLIRIVTNVDNVYAPILSWIGAINCASASFYGQTSADADFMHSLNIQT